MISPAEDGAVVLNIPNIRPYRYAIGYSFKTPLPDFTLFWSTAKEETDEVDDKPEDMKEQQVTRTEVTFNANIGGQLASPKQQVKIEFEDGEEEIRQVFCLADGASSY
jgi:DnaJ family protein C protein 11